jgi:copper chaperone CopZ
LGTLHAWKRDAYEFLLDRLMRGAHRMMWWSVFGLLSSSCCAVQLILNLFNFGCAGFNTYLGPLRPAFLALTITLNVRMWELALPNLGLPSTPEYYLHSIIASTVLAVFLSVLPEITDYRNKSRASSTGNLVSSGSSVYTEVQLSLEGLGCVACENAMQGALKKVEKIASCAIALEQKEAKIMLTCDETEAKDVVVPDIISRIESVGFEATLLTLQKTEDASTSSPAKPGTTSSTANRGHRTSTPEPAQRGSHHNQSSQPAQADKPSLLSAITAGLLFSRSSSKKTC